MWNFPSASPFYLVAHHNFDEYDAASDSLAEQDNTITYNESDAADWHFFYYGYSDDGKKSSFYINYSTAGEVTRVYTDHHSFKLFEPTLYLGDDDVIASHKGCKHKNKNIK